MSPKIDGVNAPPGSNAAPERQNLAAAAPAAPDIDEARVAEIRRALAAGTYKIDARRIAQKLLALEDDLPQG